MQQADGIAWGVAGHVGRIVLKRPERANSISLAASRALVRAIGRLQAGDRGFATPGAQCQGWIEHRFRLGPAG